MKKIFSQFTHEGIQYESVSIKQQVFIPAYTSNLLTDRYQIGLLQARFLVLSTILLPGDETKIICLN